MSTPTNGQTVARELREQGLPWREIASRLGVSKTTARRWADDDYAERHRAVAREWKQAHPEYQEADRIARAGSCSVCGKETRQGALRCREHRADVMAREDRLRRMRVMWLAGASLRQIADAEGFSTPTAAGVAMTIARKEGWDFPYRYNVVGGRRVSA